MSADLYVIWVLEFILFAVALILQGMGVLALKDYLKTSNQALLLCKLCIIEVASILLGISTDIMHIDAYSTYSVNSSEFSRVLHSEEFLHGTYPNYLIHVHEFLFTSTIGDLVLTMLLLVCDRLFSLMYPLHYRMYMKVSTVTNLTIATSLLSVFNGALLSFTPYINQPSSVVGKGMVFIFFYEVAVLFCMLGALSLTTYIVMALMVRASKRQTTNDDVNGSTFASVQFKRRRMVRYLIIITFMTSVSIPTRTLYLYVKYMLSPAEHSHLLLLESVKILYTIGFVCDPVIFIFLTGHVRRRVMEKLKKLMKKRCTTDLEIQMCSITPDQIEIVDLTEYFEEYQTTRL